MRGIVAFSSYVPRLRLPREVVAREWGQPALPGEKAIAAADEDSLTLAANAAVWAGGDDAAMLGAVYFASTTPPFAEKQAAATIAAVLDCRSTVRTVDVAGSLRAATSAMSAALDSIAAGTVEQALVCVGDRRQAAPDTVEEQSHGDAGAAVVLGSGAPVIAEVLGVESVSADVQATRRTSDDTFVRTFPGSFETKLAQVPLVVDAVRSLLARTGVGVEDVAGAIFTGPNPRASMRIAKEIGLSPERLRDTFWMTLGDTGATQPLLSLSAALEAAQPGDKILVGCYGDGADALLLRVTDRIAAWQSRRSVSSQIERKLSIDSYGTYARGRRIVRGAGEGDEPSTPVPLFRERRSLLALYGGRCPSCGTVQFPAHRVCIECGFREGLAEARLSHQGVVFTFMHDFAFDSRGLPLPVSHAVVDLEGGGRLYLQLTDCAPESVRIDLPVELTFRRIYDGSGMNNYFWKARPQ